MAGEAPAAPARAGRSAVVIVTAVLILFQFLALSECAVTVNAPSITPKKEGPRHAKAEAALSFIDDVATENWGALCTMEKFRELPLPTPGATSRHDATRQKADMATNLLRNVGLASAHKGLLDAVAKSLLAAERHVLAARVLSMNSSSGSLVALAGWRQAGLVAPGGSPQQDSEGLSLGSTPDPSALPWLPLQKFKLEQPRFMDPQFENQAGRWTVPYYACAVRRWLVSYTANIPAEQQKNSMLAGLLSVDVDVSRLDVNQCDNPPSTLPPPQDLLFSVFGLRTETPSPPLAAFLGTHKCHTPTTVCEPLTGRGWVRGAYRCLCKQGFYARKPLLPVFNGTIVELAWLERQSNTSTHYDDSFRCLQCAPGCETCDGPQPCLADYNWPFRITLLTVTCICVLLTLALIGFVVKHHKLKVFKVASPTFLSITLLGCVIMYLEMAAIFPVLDMFSCVATKWTRHLGFCITYTALLMKTWRVSLTYRVKSAHKVKLTDKQLLQWMFPILLVMLIYLGTWTLSAPPDAENITDNHGLRFKQCEFNWWDHSLAIGEVLFLAWGIRVCYNVRNAESLYNEARLISFAIYNIAVVNIAMVAFHLMIFPKAGPDIKYLLGFIRTQLSTTVTVALVFGPKVVRVFRGQGDQYDSRARARGVTASFSLNGIGLVPEEPPDLYQENEELKEEIQKLAAQIEFMRIVHMEMNNRHLKPKPGGYFSGGSKSHASARSAEPSDISFGGLPSDAAPSGSLAAMSAASCPPLQGAGSGGDKL